MRRTQELLARVQLRESERREAEHYLVMGDRAADLILEMAAALSMALQAMERAVRALAGFRSTG